VTDYEAEVSRIEQETESHLRSRETLERQLAEAMGSRDKTKKELDKGHPETEEWTSLDESRKGFREQTIKAFRWAGAGAVATGWAAHHGDAIGVRHHINDTRNSLEVGVSSAFEWRNTSEKTGEIEEQWEGQLKGKLDELQRQIDGIQMRQEWDVGASNIRRKANVVKLHLEHEVSEVEGDETEQQRLDELRSQMDRLQGVVDRLSN